MRRPAPNVIPCLIPRGKAGSIIAGICGLFEARRVNQCLRFIDIRRYCGYVRAESCPINSSGPRRYSRFARGLSAGDTHMAGDGGGLVSAIDDAILGLPLSSDRLVHPAEEGGLRLPSPPRPPHN